MKFKTAIPLRYIFYLLIMQIFLFVNSCSQEEIQKLRTENQELKNRLAALEKENSELKETADYHFRKGMEFLSNKNYEDAKKEFEIVVERFPKSPLAVNANAKIININTAIEKINAEKELQGKSKKEICRIEYENTQKGKKVEIRHYSGRYYVEAIVDSCGVWCSHGELYTRLNATDTATGEEFSTHGQLSDELSVCPKTVEKYGSICK